MPRARTKPANARIRTHRAAREGPRQRAGRNVLSVASTPDTVDAYIAAAPKEVRPILRAIRATVKKAAPGAEERISYRMPAYFHQGVVVYFAAFKKHIGLFPPVREPTLLPLVARYSGPKGNLQFPLSEPIPSGLIAKIVKARMKQRLKPKAAGRP